MATPAIQTLITDAQQVLNLKSLSEIRATLTAVLANANVGTPLNPNLTTQQLWDQFYEIVRQTPTDIESILVNQMMKFVFSPPAPGGAGANTQVIFNDGGVLAGDAGLTYNKTTDALTITGDLTVDTSTLKVDSANNRVGIVNASPTYPLDVVGTGRFVQTDFVDNIFRLSTGGSTTGNINQILFANQATTATSAITAYNSLYGSGKNYALGFTTNGSERYLIDSTGISTWSVGGTTAMTLNSTGLGIGGSAASKLSITDTSPRINFVTTSGLDVTGYIYNAIDVGTGGKLVFGTKRNANTALDALTIDSSQNVGIGVTPSYLLHTAVASGANRNMARFQVTGASNGLTITWNHATTKMIVNFSDLPTSSAGLASGDLYIDTSAGNTLKVA